MRVARDREPPDDPVLGLGDEHGRVRVTAHRAEVAALVGDASASGSREISQPSGSEPTASASVDERRGVPGLRPARDGSSLDHDPVPAAARVAGRGERAAGPTSTAATPPK